MTHVMEHAPEEKDPDGPAGGSGEKGGDVAEPPTALQFRMKDEGFDITETRCGPNGWYPLQVALCVENEPIDEEAVKLVLGVPGVDSNAPNSRGQTLLYLQCAYGRSRNVELLLADARVDPNQTTVDGWTNATVYRGKHGQRPLPRAPPRGRANGRVPCL